MDEGDYGGSSPVSTLISPGVPSGPGQSGGGEVSSIEARRLPVLMLAGHALPALRGRARVVRGGSLRPDSGNPHRTVPGAALPGGGILGRGGEVIVAGPGSTPPIRTVAGDFHAAGRPDPDPRCGEALSTRVPRALWSSTFGAGSAPGEQTGPAPPGDSPRRWFAGDHLCGYGRSCLAVVVDHAGGGVGAVASTADVVRRVAAGGAIY